MGKKEKQEYFSYGGISSPRDAEQDGTLSLNTFAVRSCSEQEEDAAGEAEFVSPAAAEGCSRRCGKIHCEDKNNYREYLKLDILK